MAGDVFGTAISGLRTFQQSLHVTSNNIANSATEGYSRQRVDISSREDTFIGNQSFGNGAQVSGVSRYHDQIIESRITTYNSSYNYQRAVNEYTTQIDELFANPSANLGNSLQNFFGSAQTVANDPGSTAGREVMIAEGHNLTDRFDIFSSQFAAYRDQANNDIQVAIGDLNGYAESIADINRSIVEAGTMGSSFPPNELLDRRDHIIQQMSEIVNLDTNNNSDGTIDVFIGKGQALVLQFNANTIVTEPGQYDARQLEIAFDNGNGSTTNITNSINGGYVGGLLDIRDNVLTEAENTLGKIALGISNDFNDQHRLGMDLNGNINQDFFVEPNAVVQSSRHNTGSSIVTANITDVSQLTNSDYELTFNGTDFTLRDMTSDKRTTISGAGPHTNLDVGFGFSLDIPAGAATGDKFLVRPTGFAGGAIEMNITNANEIAAASAVHMESSLANMGNGSLGDLQVTDITDPDVLNNVTIRFTSATQYDVIDNTTSTTMASGSTYTSGSAISFNGWQFNLSGAPEIGDEFTVEGNAGASGDNRNILALGDLQIANGLTNNTESYQDAFSRLVANIGVTTQRSDQSMIAQSSLLQQSEAQKSSISGVNLDEEAANLMRYQQAYNASAKVMTTANTMFQTLLDAIR